MQLSLATLDRFSTLFNSNTFEGEGDTLGFRLIENEYAYAAIAQHPWLGMGMGFTYRPWDSRLDQSGNSAGNDFRRHIHNGHLWIMLQSGLLGYASLMWLSGVFLWRGLRNWRHIPDPKLRAMMLGFSLVYVAVMIAAIVNSSFTQWRWTPLLGMMMGINEGIQRLSPPRTKGSPIPTMHRR